MKEILNKTLRKAIESCPPDVGLSSLPEIPPVFVEVPRDRRHGDYVTSVAMSLASQIRKRPREIAERIIEFIEDPTHYLEKVEVAGPGFINFFLSKRYWYHCLGEIHRTGSFYGRSELGKGVRVLLEFVSANPTGPLHIGHGRGAAVGDSLANILSAAGYGVFREYYINDTGSQIDKLGLSAYLRYQELGGRKVEFPEDGYPGEYIKDIAREIKSREGSKFIKTEPNNNTIDYFSSFACQYILELIRKDLREFGIEFESWFSEKKLWEEGKAETVIKELKSRGLIYEKDGALWFKSAQYGDEKDRVVVRAKNQGRESPIFGEGGEPTYFASDIAYHKDKFVRGFDTLINIWGADHHGYVPRIKASLEAQGKEPDKLKVLLVQMVSLLRDGKPISMAKRTGEFTALREVIEEVGKDAARYFFLMRRSDSHLDFDLELAKKQERENPVYYVQYAHARICSILSKARDRNIDVPEYDGQIVERLSFPEELNLIKELAYFPDLLEGCCLSLEPHRITFYLQELAGQFHRYYNLGDEKKEYRVLSDDKELTQARILLVIAIRTVLRNALTLLGVSVPERM